MEPNVELDTLNVELNVDFQLNIRQDSASEVRTHC